MSLFGAVVFYSLAVQTPLDRCVHSASKFRTKFKTAQLRMTPLSTVILCCFHLLRVSYFQIQNSLFAIVV